VLMFQDLPVIPMILLRGFPQGGGDYWLVPSSGKSITAIAEKEPIRSIPRQ